MFWGISEILLCTYYFHKTFTNTTLKLSKMKIIKQYTILQDGAFFKLKETAKQYKIKLYWILKEDFRRLRHDLTTNLDLHLDPNFWGYKN